MIKTSAMVIANLDDGIDEFINSGYKTEGRLNIALKTKEITSKVAAEILSYYNPLLLELRSIATDPDLKEAYSHLKKRDRDHYIKVVETITERMAALMDVAKAARKPRKRKPQDANKLAAKIKAVANEFTCGEHMHVSKPPADIVGSSTAFIFNVRYNIMTMLVAPKNESLTLKGQTVIGWDETTSLARRINPKKFLSGPLSTQAALAMILNKGTKAGAFVTVTGRLGENTLIIRTYK